VKNDALVDYALWRPGSPDRVGDLARGRVTAVVPAMAGAFVALEHAPEDGTASGAKGAVEGFLPDSEGAKGLTEGTMLTVRITRAASGGKGPRLTARAASVDDGSPRRGLDPLRELAARYPSAAIVVDDPALAASLRADLGTRVSRIARAFDDAIETEVENVAAPEVVLQTGARLSVHATPALVAIDIDGGSALAGRETAGKRHRAVNAAVLPELARQIRLRNLSGAILVDLAGLKAKQRLSLGPLLMAALSGDPLRPRFLGFTALGLAEISRPRVRPPLHELLVGPVASGLAALRAIAASVSAEPGRRLALRASPEVIAALQADPVALPDLARITGRALNSRSDPSLPRNGWCIEGMDG
jgi:Ribonuclease G/E